MRVLTVPRARSTRLLLIALAFTVAGIVMLGQDDFDRVVGVAAIVFFGILGLPLSAMQVLAPPRLEVDGQGFVLHQALRRPLRREWTEVGPFRTFGVNTNPYSWRRRAKQFAVVYSTSRTDRRALRSLNRSLSGGDEGLPIGFDGLSAVDLAQLLNGYRDTALRGTGPGA